MCLVLLRLLSEELLITSATEVAIVARCHAANVCDKVLKVCQSCDSVYTYTYICIYMDIWCVRCTLCETEIMQSKHYVLMSHGELCRHSNLMGCACGATELQRS